MIEIVENDKLTAGGRLMRLIATVSLLIFTVVAFAHHSRSHYSEEVRELEGELVAVHWVNPHVGFTVKVISQGGQEELWRVEGVSSLGGMQKAGVTSDMFAIGERVRAAGSVSVRRARDFLATNFLLADGTEIVFGRNVEPYWSEQYIERHDPAVAENAPVDAATENRGIFRVWSGVADGVGQRTHFPFTEAAIAARAAWDPIDNFAERCEPEGMPRIMRNPHPFEFVDHATEIAMISELYDLVRTIHMDRTAPPIDEPASPLGYSIGYWDDNELIVSTTHINWSYFDNIGTPQSEAVMMVERFTVSENQSRLDYQLKVTDPSTFTEPAVYERHWLALGEAIQRFDCRVY